MHDARVARRYANALFATALKNNVVKSVEDDFSGIAGLVDGDKSFREFLISPYVGREEKLKIAERLLSDRITAISMQAVRLMLEKRREAEIRAVYDEFVALRRKHHGVVYAEVSSAEALTKDQEKQIVAKLGLISGKTIEASFSVDPKLIGGVRVRLENTVLDGSLKGGLETLKDRLRHDVLKQF